MDTRHAILAAGCVLTLSPLAQALIIREAGEADGWHAPQLIFAQHDYTADNAWRIPAITVTQSGAIIAVSDARANGTGDIGRNTDVHFGYRISYDQGDTWSAIGEVVPNISGKNQISDPAIVYNPDSGRTFLVGFYNDRFITQKPLSEQSDFFLFTSDDGGKHWDDGVSLYNLVPPGYKYILQGPGSGMYYNGTIYIGVQAWHNSQDAKLGGATSTSGYIYSADNGNTWRAAWLRPSDKITGAPGSDGLPDISSESSVFYHDGDIHLAVKAETSRAPTGRMVYRTQDHGQSWQPVQEDFLPANIARTESSSLALDDQVYLVGYTVQTPRAGRDGIYITSNRGRTIQVYDAPTNGYTSMTQDEDNLYILFEGQGDILLQRYDLAARDYANLNATILNRSDDLRYVQEKLRSPRSYFKGGYGSDDSAGAELLYAGERMKLGVFYARQRENGKHVAGTVQYTSEDVTLALAKDALFLPSDAIFIGYQSSDIRYINRATNDVDSALLGYSYQHELGPFSYNLSVNGIYSYNRFTRNQRQGLGRTAKFKSYSAALQNALSMELALPYAISANVESGLNTTFFKHASFSEQGGNGWNNATLSATENWSHQLFITGKLSKPLTLLQEQDLTLSARASYQYELMNTDSWAETSTVLDVQRRMAAPLRKYQAGLTTGYLEAALQINPQASVVASGALDSAGDKAISGVLSYYF